MSKEHPKRNLNDRIVQTLKPAPKGTRYDQMDALVSGFGIRVSDRGERTFILLSRFPGSTNPTRRTIGRYSPLSPAEIKAANERFAALPVAEKRGVSFDQFLLRTYGATTLATAREKARQWTELIKRGIDPAFEEEKHRLAELRRQENGFAAVAEDFIKDKIEKERKGEEVARDIRRVFVKAWGARPITDISPLDVRAVVKGFADAGKLYQAHNLLSYVRRLFNWAIDQGVYGIETSPCDRLKPRALLGEKKPRNRILSDAELKAAWDASTKLAYPYGPLFQMLMLTGQRKSEVANARWSEFDLTKKLWVIPADRMKADAAHVVPLSGAVMDLLADLPRFEKGDLLFTMTKGKKQLNSFSRAKLKLDKAMLAELHSTAANNGTREQIKLDDFIIHDFRRTVRTGLSAIPGISDLVRELVIAHTKPGLHRVYDLHAYADEKRLALEAWAARLRSIVEPPPANVIPIKGAKVAQ